MATNANQVLINGTAYSWADISVVLLGRKVQGITAISYDEEMAKQNNYGQGNIPVSRSRGNKTYTGSITLSHKEVVAIENALPPGKTLADIKPFPVVVAFNNDDNQFVSYELKHVEFMKSSFSSNQGDMTIDREIPIIFSQINRVA